MVASEDIQESIKKLQGSAAWEVKQMEIMSLGHWGVNDPALVPPLINIALNSPHKVLRKSAVGLLGNIGGPKVTETLIMLLLKSPLVTIRFAAAKALGNLKPVDAISYLEAILQDVEEEASVREAVVETLGKIGTKNAMEPLFLILKGKDEQGLQEKVIEILGNSGTKEAIESIISVLVGTLGRKAESILKELGEPAVMPLISVLSTDNQEIRKKVIEILGELRAKEATEPLVAILADENIDEEFLAFSVMPALGKIGDSKAVEPLIKLASKHTEEIITGEAVFALGEIGDHKAVDALTSILEDERDREGLHLIIAALESLKKMPDKRAIKPLIKFIDKMTEKQYWDCGYLAACALAKIDDDVIESPLLKYFNKKFRQAKKQFSSGDAKEAGKLTLRLIDKNNNLEIQRELKVLIKNMILFWGYNYENTNKEVSN